MLGAALFFGDGLFTPAISVLSAVEGVVVAQPDLSAIRRAVDPLAILVGLFAGQSKGTGASRDACSDRSSSFGFSRSASSVSCRSSPHRRCSRRSIRCTR